jgi:hypothetical protein
VFVCFGVHSPRAVAQARYKKSNFINAKLIAMSIFHANCERYCRFSAPQASLLTHLNSTGIDFIHEASRLHALRWPHLFAIRIGD